MEGAALEGTVQVVSGERLVKRVGHGVVAVLECGEAFGDLLEVGESLGGDDFAPDDGKDDLDVIQPGRVDGQVDQRQGGLSAFEAVDRRLAPM